jgi:hypothetical protein
MEATIDTGNVAPENKCEIGLGPEPLKAGYDVRVELGVLL